MTIRLYILNILEERYGKLQAATEARIARQNWLASIPKYAEDGRVALCQWYRDCDGCEGTSRMLIDAIPSVIDEQINHDFEWADGPMHHWLQAPSTPFERTHRDRVLEAFEDGHPWSI